MSSRTTSKKSKAHRLKACPAKLSAKHGSKVSPTQSSVSPRIPHSAFRIPRSQAFTLIELLVAMGILMILVLMLANLFQASTRAWEAGMLQAEVGLQARNAIAAIQKDLSQAMASSNFTFTARGNTLSFYTFQSDTGMPQHVTYSGGLSRNGIPLLENAEFTVDTYYGELTGDTNLPDWVQISLSVSSDREFSGVRVFAQDREYTPGGKDWVDTR